MVYSLHIVSLPVKKTFVNHLNFLQMKALLFFAAIVCLSYLSACNKDDNNQNNGTKLLISYTSSLYLDTINYSYNSSNELIQTEDLEDRSTITINGNQLHYIEYRKTESRQVADATFTLDAAGNVVTGQGSFSYSISSPYTTQFTFTYDASGNMINRTDARSGGMTYSYDFTWSNGDMVSQIWKLNGALYATNNFIYYTDKDDKNQINGYNFLSATNSFTGNSSRHLFKNISTIFAPGTTVTDEYGYAYTLDADGYPTTATITGITIPSTDIAVYHYQ